MSAQPPAKKGTKTDPHCLLLDPATIPAGKKGLAVRLDFTKASCRHVAECRRFKARPDPARHGRFPRDHETRTGA